MLLHDIPALAASLHAEGVSQVCGHSITDPALLDLHVAARVVPNVVPHVVPHVVEPRRLGRIYHLH